uniref:ORF2B n=1 Tax=Euplotes crassus TaxID=5936 RepID=V9H074_EUPCR|nr:ORF2B [Moneuplotes crassus]
MSYSCEISSCCYQTRNRKLYNKYKRECGGNDPVAFYIFRSGISLDSTRRDCGRIFANFQKQDVGLDHNDVFDYFKFLDEEQIKNKNTIKKEYGLIRRILNVSYAVDKTKFPRANFKSKKRLKSVNKNPALSRKLLLEICNELYAKDYKMEALVVHLMFACALRADEVRFLMFNNIKKDRIGTSIVIYRSKTEEEQTLAIDQDLEDRIEEYKQILIKAGKYIEETRYTTRGEQKRGIFIFKDSYIWVYRLFIKRFKEILGDDFGITPAIMRSSAISDTTGEGNIIQAARLANHKDMRITRKHYLAAQKPFEVGREERKE